MQILTEKQKEINQMLFFQQLVNEYNVVRNWMNSDEKNFNAFNCGRITGIVDCITDFAIWNQFQMLLPTTLEKFGCIFNYY